MRCPLEGITPPDVTAPAEQVRTTLSAAHGALERALGHAEQSRDELEYSIASTRRRQARTDPDPWKLLERAYSAYEAELISARTIKDRVAEGRRSLTPKIERAIHEEMLPKVEKQGGQFVATLSRTNLDKLEHETLPGWRDGWLRFTFNGINRDFTRMREKIWQPHEGELPVPLPPFADLANNQDLQNAIGLPELPSTVLSKDIPKFGSSVYRKVRTVLYAVLSLSFVGSRACNDEPEQAAAFSGVDSRDVSDATDALQQAVDAADHDAVMSAAKEVLALTQPSDTTELMGFFTRMGEGLSDIFIWLLIPTALAFGIWQARSERYKEHGRLEEDLRNKSERAVKDALRHWLDRATDHLTEDIRRQLYERRKTLREWYRTQVQPEIDRAQRARERAAERLEEKQRDAAALRQRISDLERLRGELQRLELTLS